MTSILITSDTEVEVPEPLVELDGVDPAWGRSCSTEFESQDRERDSDTIKVRTYKYGREKNYCFQHSQLTGTYSVYLVTN